MVAHQRVRLQPAQRELIYYIDLSRIFFIDYQIVISNIETVTYKLTAFLCFAASASQDGM